MPKTFTTETQGFSVRLPVETLNWLKDIAEENGEPTNDVIRRLVDDYRSLYGLPQTFTHQLDADMKANGLKDRREYIMHLLAARLKEILSKGPGFDKEGGKPSKR